MTYLLIQGNPVDGFHYHGPFTDRATAEDIGENEYAHWWVEELVAPDMDDVKPDTYDVIYTVFVAATVRDDHIIAVTVDMDDLELSTHDELGHNVGIPEDVLDTSHPGSMGWPAEWTIR